jgi:hypothetical protein
MVCLNLVAFLWCRPQTLERYYDNGFAANDNSVSLVKKKITQLHQSVLATPTYTRGAVGYALGL